MTMTKLSRSASASAADAVALKLVIPAAQPAGEEAAAGAAGAAAPSSSGAGAFMKLTLDDALQHMAHITLTNEVIDARDPASVYSLETFHAAFRGNNHMQAIGNGNARKVAVTEAWCESTCRRQYKTKTWRPGELVDTVDFEGRSAFNLWRAPQRGPAPDTHVDALALADCDCVIAHIRELFGEDAERFLDWLAHIEQQPQQLAHTAWLHIAPHQGTGRSWLAGFLARVWPGLTRPNLPVEHLFGKFNGQLAGLLLGVVHEIREGCRSNSHQFLQKLRALITDERRTIQRKYEQPYEQANVARFLMFSNHSSALPLDGKDRRIEVVHYPHKPKPEDYYARLFAITADGGRACAAANAFAHWLRARDISRFNAGKHAQMSEAKRVVIAANETDLVRNARMLVELGPSDLVPTPYLLDILESGPTPRKQGNLNADHRRALEDLDIAPHPKTPMVKVDGRVMRFRVVRNHEKWMNATPAALAMELAKWPLDLLDAPQFGPDSTGPHKYLQEQAAPHTAT